MANHVKSRRKELKLTQQKVADAAGTTKATVMKLEKGDMQLTENWLQRLSVPLECRPEDLVTEEWPQDIPIIGEVSGPSKVTFLFDLPQAGLAEPATDQFKKADKAPRLPQDGYRDVMALRVKDGALEPLLPKDSLVYYAEPKTEGFDDYTSQLTVCELENGEVHVTRLQAGQSFGTYDLLRSNAVVINDAKLNWCARVIFMKPA